MYRGLVDAIVGTQRRRVPTIKLFLYLEFVFDCHDQADQDHQNTAACEQPFDMGEHDQYPGEHSRL